MCVCVHMCVPIMHACVHMCIQSHHHHAYVCFLVCGILMSTELQTFPMHDICSFKMTNNDFILAIVAFIITLGSLICV